MLSQKLSSSSFSLTLIIVLAMCLYTMASNSCSRHNCQPPLCRCPGHGIPGNLRPEKVPQMVYLTFDDAVNWDNWDYYLRLFPPDGRRKNPNGCPQQATFFVSHNYTDYCMVGKLHARGMEIADHSVSHKLPRKWWTDADERQIGREVLGQKHNLATKANIPESEIRGWRSPFLQPAGDDLYGILFKNNFTYDATMTYSFPKNLYSPVLWPFTMDFGYTLVCNIARCPKKSYPGFWVVPVVVMMDYREQKPCAYVDHCDNTPKETSEAYQFLWKNFLRNYRSNKAPVYLNLHSPWLSEPNHLDAMDQLLEKFSQMDDVYVTTVHKGLQWQMDPTPLDRLDTFKPWACSDFQPNKEDRKFCSFTFRPKGKVERRHESPDPKTDKRRQRYEEMRKRQNEENGGSTSTHLRVAGKKGSSDNTNGGTVDNDGKSDQHDGHDHNHDHRPHKPWFLRNSASSHFLTHNYFFLSFSVVTLLTINVL